MREDVDVMGVDGDLVDDVYATVVMQFSVQPFTAIFDGKQLNALLNGCLLLISCCQRLLQTVARENFL